MDLYKKITNLKVTDTFFKDIKFYFTGSLPDWILQVLIRGGAKQMSHISDFMTHLIVGSNPDANEIDEVKDIYDKPVVTHLWIIYSAKCEKILPTEGFLPDNNQLFSGVKASVSKLGIDDTNIIWGLITYYGGKCTIDLDHTCTHLVVGKSEGIKYKRALEKPILIVTPDWVIDSIQFNERKNEDSYHPKLLNVSHPLPHSSYLKTPNSRKIKKECIATNSSIGDCNLSTSVRPSSTLSSPIPIAGMSTSVSFDTCKQLEESGMPAVRKSHFSEKSLFDSLIFSDEEEEGSDGDRKSLLDQLKSTQPWKQSSASFMPLPVCTSALHQQTSSSGSIANIAATTTSSIETIPTISVSFKNLQSTDNGIFSQKEQQNKASLPSMVNISTPSISITSQSSSSTLIPSSLTGSLVTPTISNSNKVVVTSSISTASSIVSTSEVDISFISKQNTQTSSASCGPLSHSSQLESVALTVQSSSARSTPSPVSSVTRPEVQPIIYTGKPLSKSFSATSALMSHVRPSTSFNAVYSTLPPFSSTQPTSVALSSQQKLMTTSAATTYISTIGGPSSTNVITQSPYNSNISQQVIMSAVRQSPRSVSPSQSPGIATINSNLRPETVGLVSSKAVPPNVVLRHELVNATKGHLLPPNIRSEVPCHSTNQLVPSSMTSRMDSSHSSTGQVTPPNVIRSEIQNLISGHGIHPSSVIRNDVLNQTLNSVAPSNVAVNNLSQVQPMTSPSVGPPLSLPSVTDVIASTVHSSQFQGHSVNQSPVPIHLIRQSSISIVGSQGQAHPGGNSGVTISSSGNMTQQQVHFGAIPGAVVRLPVGVTHQQLQMMNEEERQKFLEQLHRTQIQAQRGKPRPGKPVSAQQQYKPAPPGTIRYQNAVVRSTQPSALTGLAQPSSPQATGNWPPSSPAQLPLIQQGTAAGAVGGSPTVSYGPGKIRSQAPTTTGSGWQTTPQQPQFATATQGTLARVVVGLPGWQQQPSVQPVATPQPQQQTLQTTQGLLPPHQMQQVHAQQLRQHFPSLTHQEAQQLIQTIPTHLRELSARDSNGRFEYLTQLEPKERQVVNHFYLRRHQQQLLQARQQQLQAQQQAQLKIGAVQQSPSSWQQQPQQTQQQVSQFGNGTPHPRPISGRTISQNYAGQTVVSPGQSSPHLIQSGQLTPHVSPLASPHGHSPIQRSENGSIVSHPALQGSSVAQNLINQQNLVNPKTKTALANLLTNRLSGTVHQGAPGTIEGATHIVHKQRIPSEGVQVVGPGGEQVVVYQRQTLANITGTLTNNVVRPPGVTNTTAALYPRSGLVSQPGSSPVMTSPAAHYPTRPHFHGHDINTMLPRELCMVGCVFYIADYYSDIAPETLNIWKIVIQQHGGEVVNLYDSLRVTHVLCQHQKSPVFQQAVRENKRCITIYWVNDILIRGKMAPPWQAIHLPTPFGTNDKPMKDMLVSISGFENEERAAIKIMLLLAGAKYTGYFSKHNHLLICKKFEGPKVSKARDWKRSVVNGAWLSEVLLGQNTPPLVYLGTRYQHYLDDPLRIDPSLASHLFNAWKLPISVSKESVEKAKAVRELALRKRKSENDGDQETKRTPHLPPLPPSLDSQMDTDNQSETQLMDPSFDALSKSIKRENISDSQIQQPKILLSNIKNKEELEKKILALGGTLARTNADFTHLVMGSNEMTAPRTVKLLCAISCATHIVCIRWLDDSHAYQRFIDEEEYQLNMPEFGKVFNFSLQETLKRPNRNELFAGKHFYLTPSVVPGRAWLKEIIECTGGIVDSKRKSLNYIKEVTKDGKYLYICIAHESDTHLVKDLIQEGLCVFNSEFVMASILKQEIDYASSLFHLSCTKEE